jgi:hypothetical protein
MQAAGPALSIAAVGLKAANDYESSRGTAAADKFKAEELDRAAQYGDLKATQTNAQMTRNLSITLGNIDAVRAAARSDPTSPTGAAVRDYAEYTGTEQKTTKVSSIMDQAAQDEADAAYMRSSASRALLSGDLSIAGDVIGAGGGAIAGLPGLQGIGAVGKSGQVAA